MKFCESQDRKQVMKQNIYNIFGEGPGEIAQWLKALIARREDLSSIQFLTPKWQFTTVCNSNSRASEVLF